MEIFILLYCFYAKKIVKMKNVYMFYKKVLSYNIGLPHTRLTS